MENNTVVLDPRKAFAAQSAQIGLIGVSDLSLLTGVAPAVLNSFAKKGLLRSYDEYHGKRFFNFGEIVTWLNDYESEDEAKQMIRSSVKAELKAPDCPYVLSPETPNETSSFRIVWKEPIPSAA